MVVDGTGVSPITGTVGGLEMDGDRVAGPGGYPGVVSAIGSKLGGPTTEGGRVIGLEVDGEGDSPTTGTAGAGVDNDGGLVGEG